MVRDDENCLVYQLDRRQLNRVWLEQINDIISDMDEENISFKSGPTASLVKYILNSLDTEFMFSIQDLPFSWTPQPSSKFLMALAALEKGDRIYVGSVLECR